MNQWLTKYEGTTVCPSWIKVLAGKALKSKVIEFGKVILWRTVFAIFIALLLTLVFPSASFAFEVLQKNRDVTVTGEVSQAWPSSVLTGDGEVKIQLEDNLFEVFEDTQLRWEHGRKVIFEKGLLRVHWAHEESLLLDSPVADVSLGRGDYVVRYLPEVAVVRVEVVEGLASIQGHYREERLSLAKNQKGEFEGIVGPEGPTYDLLLQGRRAIHGRLKGPVVMITTELEELLAKRKIETKPPPKKVVLKAKPGQICKEPFAKFNECVARCKNNPKSSARCQIESEKVHCLLERCSADGRWSHGEKLFGSAKKLCRSVVPQLVPCDK